MALMDEVYSKLLVGRSNELKELERALEAARSGVGQCVVVAGEAGIGKSRLIAEGTKRAEESGSIAFVGRCFENDSTFPFAPIIDGLLGYISRIGPSPELEHLGPLGAELGRLVPELLPKLARQTQAPPRDAETQKRLLFEAVSQFLVGLSRAQPVLVILEELHWSDESSLDFISYFSRRVRDRPVLLVGSYRAEDMSPRLATLMSNLERDRGVTSLNLRPLDKDELGEMIRSVFSMERRVRGDFLEEIHRLSDWNPFFVEEILKDLILSGGIFYADYHWDRRPMGELAIPESVELAVAQRTERLSQDGRRVVHMATVAGRRFDLRLVTALTGLSEPGLILALGCPKDTPLSFYTLNVTLPRSPRFPT